LTASNCFSSKLSLSEGAAFKEEDQVDQESVDLDKDQNRQKININKWFSIQLKINRSILKKKWKLKIQFKKHRKQIDRNSKKNIKVKLFNQKVCNKIRDCRAI
jgi:hypothetical protein